MDKLASLRQKNIAVFMGGWSSEREISLNSGNLVLESLSRMGLKASRVDLKSEEDSQKNFNNFNLVFNALHGIGGEDGFIQSILEKSKINYTGSDSVSSRISLNKIETKKIWRDLELPTADFVEIKDIKLPNMELNQFISGSEEITSLNKSFVIKPAREGSSFGISIVHPNEGTLEESLELASEFDKDILVEAFIEGIEMTVGILGNKALTPFTIIPSNKFYDYQSKYISNKTIYKPSKLSTKKIKEIQDLSLKAFQSLGCSGWGRVDFIQDLDGNFQLLEVNTVPGLTPTSLVPKAALSSGLNFDDLIIEIIRSSES